MSPVSLGTCPAVLVDPWSLAALAAALAVGLYGRFRGLGVAPSSLSKGCVFQWQSQ